MDYHSFTEQYLAIIRDTLQVQTTDDGKKKYQWTEDTADELTRRLENHFNSFALQSPQPVRTLLSRCTRFITGIHRT
jgi:uncharacterized protein YpbB